MLVSVDMVNRRIARCACRQNRTVGTCSEGVDVAVGKETAGEWVGVIVSCMVVKQQLTMKYRRSACVELPDSILLKMSSCAVIQLIL